MKGAGCQVKQRFPEKITAQEIHFPEFFTARPFQVVNVDPLAPWRFFHD